MRTRTLLTTPPGATPEAELGRRRTSGEIHTPYLDLPEEPRVPGRFRRLGTVLAVLAVLGLLGAAVVLVGLQEQYEDPALTGVPGD
jgi:hypothetical protein